MNKCGVVHGKLACGKVDPSLSRIAPLGHTQAYHQLKYLIYKRKSGLCTKNTSLYYYVLHIKRINNREEQEQEERARQDWRAGSNPRGSVEGRAVLARILKDHRACQRKATRPLADGFPVPLIPSRSLNP
jgi:hypothetical protein